jgi:predicted ATPase
VWLGAGQCIEQFGEGEAYLPLLTALSQLGQGPEGQRLAELLKRYAPTWLLQLPSLLKDEDLTVLQQRTIGATSARMVRELAEALEALTAEQPVILVLEDLHWSDHATVNWLAFMARRRQPARLLVAATYRPVEILSQSHPLRPVLQELLAHQHCVELPLRGLTAEEVETYVDQRFPASALPTRLPQLLHRQTEGNPLFLVSLVEELVANGRVVVQNGHWVFAGGSELAALSVPDNIRQLVARQRERLSPEEQQVLGAASVAGLEFPTAAVAAALSRDHAVVEAHCQQLAVRQHFLRRAGIQEWPDGTRSAQYGFLHALYQQLWHEQVSAPHLQQWHLRIGQRKEAAYNGRAPEIAAELALHFEQGGDQGRAVEYLQHAVNNALQRSAHQEALVHLTRGLRLLHTLPDTPERGRQELIQQVALGEALIALKGYAAPEVRAAYARARELCQRIEDLSQLLPLAGLYKFSVVRGDYHTGRELALAVLELAERVHDPTLFMVAHAMLGYVLFFSGELVAASDQLERSIALYDLPQHRFLTTFYGDDPKVASLGFLAWLRWLRGYPDQAVQSSREAWSLAQELAHPYVLTMTSGFTAQLACFRREGPVTRRQAEVALAQAREHGFPLWSTVSTILRGWALMEQGETEAGLAQLREGLSAYQTLGADSNQPHYLALLAQAYEKAGQYGQALEALDQALALLTATRECFYEAELYRLKGELLLKMNASRDV